MPYRRRGTRVEKKEEDGRWVPVKNHPTVRQAEKQLTALNINVHKKKTT